MPFGSPLYAHPVLGLPRRHRSSQAHAPAAILCINQKHHREPITDRQALGRCHVVIGSLTGVTLILFMGSISGLPPEIVGPLSGTANTALPAFNDAPY